MFIALVIVSVYFMSSLVACSGQERALRLQLAYHVVELREVLLEHAESIATPPQAWPDAPAGQRQPGVEDTPSSSHDGSFVAPVALNAGGGGGYF